jgi:glycosyltransferase involved in cell wall biosynthesis
MDACKALQLPLVVHFHGYDAYRADVMENEGQHYPELFAIASKVIAVSKPMKEQLNKLGCPLDKIALIPYGIDTKYFCKTRPQPYEKNILFCGRLVEKKNPILALEVFQVVLHQIPDAQLTIAGNGPLRLQVESFIVENKLHNHVKMLGAVSSEEVKSQLNKSQVFFLPSGQSQDNDSEGTPVSILEASAMEVPIVSTFHAGIPEAVLNNKTGFLCENSATHQMAGRIIELLQDKSLAQEMGKAGRDHILKNYRRQKQIQKLSDLLSSV